MKQVRIIFITCEVLAILGVITTAYASCNFTVATLISVLAIWAIACQKEQQEANWMDYVDSL